jgi:hypothetical protein
MLLHAVLREIQSAPGMVNLDDLSRKLGVERSALEAMIAFWVRKGRVRTIGAAEMIGICANGDCGTSCSAEQACVLATEKPYAFSPGSCE